MEQYLLAKQLAKPKEKIPIIVSWGCVCSFCVWVVWFVLGLGVFVLVLFVGVCFYAPHPSLFPQLDI